MLKQEIYINGYSSFNPVKDSGDSSDIFRCVEPDYKKYLDNGSVRRLGRIQKMSMVAAKICLDNADNVIPGAIITGTGLGCLEDTEKFLNNMLEDEKGTHSPTSFIQSTHNTVSGQIAIMVKCNGYNNTFSHRGLSFEVALEDACLLLSEGQTDNVLVGAADEMPENILKITQKVHLFHSQEDEKQPVSGEGVHFFLCSKTKKESSSVKLAGFDFAEGKQKFEDILLLCHKVLFTSGIEPEEIDAVILGTNPDSEEPHYQYLNDQLFSTASILNFKHLTGESFTASGFSLILGCQLLESKPVDERFFVRKNEKRIETVLIYNQFKGVSHSFFVLQRV